MATIRKLRIEDYSSIFQLLTSKDNSIDKGIVTGRKSSNLYEVKINNRKVIIKSASSELIKINDKVIIVRSDEGMIIIGKDRTNVDLVTYRRHG